jgi:hypothetical protein
MEDSEMTRPHEDLERHTFVDHRPGGVPISFAAGAWCAIDVVHIKADRVGAGMAAYETLIEKARTSALGVRVAAVLRSLNDRRVIALVDIEGHEAFRHLQSAWDDHHLVAQRRDVAESSALALYRVATTSGDASIDPASKDAYAFARVTRGSQVTNAIARGALVFESDGGESSIVIYRFGRPEDLDGETMMAVRPVRTFG